MQGRKKIARTYRLSEEILGELREIAQTLGISETEAVSRAVHSFYLSLKGEEQRAVSGAIVPISEYQRVRDRLEQAMYKVGELQGELKAKEELIAELRNHIKEFQEAKPVKRWWEFWK